MSYDLLIKFNSNNSGNTLQFGVSDLEMDRLRDTLSEHKLLDFEFKGAPVAPARSKFKGPQGNIAYERAMQRHLSFHRKNNKVPCYKLGSNLGWHVTSEECVSIYSALGNYDATNDKAWNQRVRAFAVFCLTASKFGGFNVY